MSIEGKNALLEVYSGVYKCVATVNDYSVILIAVDGTRQPRIKGVQLALRHQGLQTVLRSLQFVRSEFFKRLILL